MTIDRDDPKWTAYVLGELGDAERVELEREIASSREAMEFIEELRLATAMLKSELSPSSAPLLKPEQRNAIRAASIANTRSVRVMRGAVWATSIAAALLIVATVSIPSLLRSRQSGVPQVATLPESSISEQYSSPPPSRSAQSLAPRREDAAAQEAQVSPSALPVESNAANTEKKESTGVAYTKVAPASPGPPSPVYSGVLGGVLRDSAQTVGRAAAAAQEMRPVLDRRDPQGFNTEAYDRIMDNPFIRVSQNPLSTLSIDVDTASYANVRRFLNQNQMPPKDAVRIEELVNYFSYSYPEPRMEHPIAAHMEVTSVPWNPRHRLVKIGIKGRQIDLSRRPASNLVFLIDVSGSMQPPQKLPLLKSAMKLLVDQLNENDRVSIVVYAGASGVVLPPTSGDKKEVIIRALENLEAGGSTNGASGIQLAYNMAVSNFIRGGINRVILATDGDFNVGVTNQGDLTRLIEDKARSGVFLSVAGFGMGNLKDSTLEKLADIGNGNYAYIDSLNEARKVLVEEMGGTLMTIAKDVKIQVEFNPSLVNAYRLIGYENRVLRPEDFNDDLKDAGDMGAGHTVTALFEIVPAGMDVPASSVDPLKYQAFAAPVQRALSGELLNLKIRYKEPEENRSKLLEVPLVDRGADFAAASSDFRFAAAVAEFGMILRDSPYKGNASYDAVLDIAGPSKGVDKGGYRAEFIDLVRRARALNELR